MSSYVIVSRLNIQKAIQASAILLGAVPEKTLTRMKLLKQLYIAERLSWKMRQAPILSDIVLAMKLGPVCEGVYRMIKGEHRDWRIWARYIKNLDTRNLKLIKQPGRSLLSEFEVSLLRALASATAHYDGMDLSKITHEKFPEWKKNYPVGACDYIPLKDILTEVGLGDRAESIIKQESYLAYVDELFSGAQAA